MKYRKRNIYIDTGYKTLKEARIAAREAASKFSSGRGYTNYAHIYLEPDGTYSINGYLNGNAKYIMTIDKAGVKYQWKTVCRKDGTKRKELVKM